MCERSSKHQTRLCFMTRPEGGALLLKCSGVQEEKVDQKSTLVTTVDILVDLTQLDYNLAG